MSERSSIPGNGAGGGQTAAGDTCAPARGDESVLVFAPTGSDALRAGEALAGAGMAARPCAGIEDVCRAVASGGAGAILIAREALTPPALDRLVSALAEQPPWSDLPLLVLTGGGGRFARAGESQTRALDALGGATFLERPLRTATLVRAVRAALAARRRQYEIRDYLRERERAAAERAALLEVQRAFLRDVLSSVTAGKLRLCDSDAQLPARLPSPEGPMVLRDDTVRRVRQRAEAAARDLGFGTDRRNDLVTATGEAAMNAVRHAGGGTALVGASETEGAGVVQVWIEDRGRGIDVARLPRATLEPGFSYAGTLGHGFWFMLNTADRLYLMTGPSGTTVVIEVERDARQTGWFSSP